MRRWNPSTEADDDGSAALEFIIVGLLLLVPLVYLIVSLGVIQSHALGAEAAARHLARTVATSEDTADADRVLAAVIEEYGMDAEDVDVAVGCIPAGAPCPEAGATLVVTVASRVALPLVPPVLGLDRLASIPVEASAVQKVSRFWGAE